MSLVRSVPKAMEYVFLHLSSFVLELEAKWLELEQSPWTMKQSDTLRIADQQQKKPRSIYIRILVP